MIQKIINYLDDNKMIEPGDNVVLGISGGADSVCLLFVLLEYKKIVNFTLTAIHVNHMIRGEMADSDQQYVESLCRENKVSCIVKTVDIPHISKECGLGIEESARIERYRIFNEENPDKIAVAHHSNDLAETMLFNLARGSGLKGLSSIRPVNGNIIRPLLCVEKKEIEAFLLDRGIEYCKDITNENTDYSRNRIRNNIIPELVLINEKAISHMRESADYIDEAEEYLKNVVKDIYDDVVCDGKININQLKNCEVIIQKKIVKQAIVKATQRERDITASHVLDVLRLSELQSGKRIDLPYGVFAIREYDYIAFKQQQRPERAELSDHFEKEIIQPVNRLQYPVDMYTKWFDCAKIKGELVCRYRQKGDYLHIKGGRKKLQDLFSDLKIPTDKRDEIPLLCDEEEVIWIVGYRINEDYKITDNTDRIMEVRYKA